MTLLLGNGHLMTGWFLIDDHSPSLDSIDKSDLGHCKLSSKQRGDNCTGGADMEGSSQKLLSFYDQAGCNQGTRSGDRRLEGNRPFAARVCKFSGLYKPVS